MEGLLTGALGWVVGGAAALVTLAGVVAALGRCRHPGPLGLLPAVMGDDGVRRPPRWFCEGCGRTWPAIDLSGPGPVPRFEGYDQTKAVAAAKRAETIARRRREIAMERTAQLVAKPAPTRRERSTGPIDIRNRRAG